MQVGLCSSNLDLPKKMGAPLLIVFSSLQVGADLLPQSQCTRLGLRVIRRRSACVSLLCWFEVDNVGSTSNGGKVTVEHGVHA